MEEKPETIRAKTEVAGPTFSGTATQEFMNVFHQLDNNINGELVERAWRQFDTIRQQVVLEGNKKAWIACSFYTTVWQTTPIGQELMYQYSVSRLLKICNLSVLEFFEKLNKWSDMINAGRRLQEHVTRVQASLAVSTVVYKKFLPIFRRVFANVTATTGTRKSQATQLQSTSQLFELIWVMFIALKKQFAAASDNLMNCFHLLLCIVEIVCQDLRNSELEKFFNPNFAKEFANKDLVVLEYLCTAFDGVVLDAKHFRTHWLIPKLKKLLDERTISLGGEITGLVAKCNTIKEQFEEMYDDAMRKKAEIDERLFLSSVESNVEMIFNEALDASAITLLRRCDLESSWAVDAELLLRMSTQTCLERLETQKVQTPMSAKSYVVSSDQFCPVTPVSASVHRSHKLNELLKEEYRPAEADFDEILMRCPENPKYVIAQRIATFGDALMRKVHEEKSTKGTNFDEPFSSTVVEYQRNVEAIFWRLLQDVVMHDHNRAEVTDLSAILMKDDFQKSLWVCALELVLFTYGSEREFPWSADLVGIAPVNFYKIVELIIRAVPDLSRDMVKHFNRVEERVLEELAWTHDSPLWNLIARKPDCIPSAQAVALSPTSSLPQHPAGGVMTTVRPSLGFPTSSIQRYAYSPMKPYDRLPVKRRLVAYDDVHGVMEPTSKRAIMPEQSEQGAEQPAVPPSVMVFFRKVYYLAAIRLNDLCDRIRLDELNRQKVWTLFEHVIRKEPTLMMGRHLDQNLMCCLYIVTKIASVDVSFHDIMYYYRHQPQAASRVYRRVLMDPSTSPATMAAPYDDGASRDSISSVASNGVIPGQGGKLRSGSALPAPDMTSAPPTPEPHNQEFADLIKFYNRIFVGRVEDFVKRVHPTGNDSKENMVALAPLPRITCNTLSPRRIIGEQVNVIPLSMISPMQGRPARYSFNRSPSKDLKNINVMVRAPLHAS